MGLTSLTTPSSAQNAVLHQARGGSLPSTTLVPQLARSSSLFKKAHLGQMFSSTFLWVQSLVAGSVLWSLASGLWLWVWALVSALWSLAASGSGSGLCSLVSGLWSLALALSDSGLQALSSKLWIWLWIWV